MTYSSDNFPPISLKLPPQDSAVYVTDGWDAYEKRDLEDFARMNREALEESLTTLEPEPEYTAGLDKPPVFTMPERKGVYILQGLNVRPQVSP